MKIENLTESEIEQLASTWSLKVKRPILFYRIWLRDTKKGLRNIELLPYFVIKLLKDMGYDIL